MTDSANLGQWIPVIGTLLGASIGFAASFISTAFIKVKDEQHARQSRDRERIERIYELLVLISGENSSEMGNAISWIHHAWPIKEKEVGEIPPLIELEMLIRLYFPEFEIQRKNLMNQVQSFGKHYFECRFKDYRKESLEVRQRESTVLAEYSKGIDLEIEAMQKLLAAHVKA